MIKEILFMRKAKKIVSPGTSEFDMEPEDKIIIKILLFAYNHMNSKKFKLLNKNKICLYDSCLFLLFIVRWIYCSKRFLTRRQKDNFDSDMISRLSVGYSTLFHCKAVKNVSINVSRILHYEELVEDYFYENDKNDISPAFEVFLNILKSDIISNSFSKISSDSPLILLNDFMENILCEIEAKYVLEMGTKIFNDEITDLILK